MTKTQNNQTQEVLEKKVIYRARRGLKELDFYLDYYVKQHYQQASDDEKAIFAILVEQEDPDLLDWFMNISEPQDLQLKTLIEKIKVLKNAEK